MAAVDIKTKIMTEEWSFSDLTLDLVITEKEEGIYEAVLGGPDFLSVKSLKVNSLKPSATVDKFGWLAGGSAQKDFNTDAIGFGLSGGVRIGKTYGIINATTNQTISGIVLLEF